MKNIINDNKINHLQVNQYFKIKINNVYQRRQKLIGYNLKNKMMMMMMKAMRGKIMIKK